MSDCQNMNKYFLDTNFFLDVADSKHQRHLLAADCFRRLLEQENRLFTSSDILTTVAYFVQKHENLEQCLKVMDMIASEVEIVCATNNDFLKLNHILQTENSKNDYEDALQFYLADKSECHYLITSDNKFCEHLREVFTTEIIGLSTV